MRKFQPKNDDIPAEFSFKRSVASRLLTIVFSIYVLIAILMTALHMMADYEKAKLDVLDALQVVHETMSLGIATALWEVNTVSLNTTVKAMTKLPDVGGVVVTGKSGNLESIAGTILDEKGRPIASESNPPIDFPNNHRSLFSFSAPVIYVDQYDQEEMGTVTVYAEEGASFDRVSFGFVIIVINSIIKTLALWVIFLWVSRPILHHPLRRLTAAVDDLNLDDLRCDDLDVGITGENELSVLQHAFNNMIHKINYSMQALEDAKLMLEKKVEERTKDLNEKNIELQKAYKILEDISSVDHLTGWRNRRYLHDHVPYDTSISIRDYKNWLEGNDDVSPPAADLIFFLIDLDHFKEVNDQFGHAVGDAILKQLCTLLKSICRTSDYCVRWGGEEFLIVARFVDRGSAPKFADRIIKLVEDYEFTVNDNTSVHKTCSLGFSSFPFCMHSPDTFSWAETIVIADKALYAAKNSGRNTWVGLTCREDIDSINLHNDIVNHTADQIELGNILAMTSLPDCSQLTWKT